MPKLSITAKHPIRESLAGLADYWVSPEDAACAVRDALAAYELRMDDPVWKGDEGYTTCIIRPDPDVRYVCECCEEKLDRAGFENVVHFSYYKIRDGRWEIIKYVS